MNIQVKYRKIPVVKRYPEACGGIEKLPRHVKTRDAPPLPSAAG